MVDIPPSADCYCCGRSFTEGDLARLACHDEVALCGGCIGWLAGQVGAVTRAVPVLASSSLEDQSAFWSAAGFDVETFSDDFGAAVRDGVELHLVEVNSQARDRGEAYLHVRDVDAIHAAWAAAGLAVSEVRDEPWGMREFNVADPGGNRIRVGRSL